MKNVRMKDSGIDWIGRIPEHWEVCRLKDSSQIVLGKMLMSHPPQGQEHRYTLEKYLKSKNVGWLELKIDDDNVDKMWFSEVEKSMYKLNDNDIVMNEGGDIGKVALWKNPGYDCYIQNSINKITANADVESKFLYYWLYRVALAGYFKAIVAQISIAHLTKEKLSITPTVLPPLPEQQAIAAYLDTHLSQIDSQVSLLTSQRAAYLRLKKSVIHQAVTKGITPHVKMKKAGVEWIGEIPEHWEVRRGKDIITFIKGRTPASLSIVECGLPYLTMDYLRDREGKDVMYPSNSADLLEVEANEILVLWDGANAGEFILSKHGYLGSTMALICTNHKLSNKGYLYYLLKSIEYDSRYFSNGTTIPHFDAQTMLTREYALPPLPEQQAIAAYLDDKCAQIDAAIANIEKQISRYADLKRSLIDEVVTGKRSV